MPSNQPPLVRPEFLDLPAYAPVQPVEELARRIGMAPADVLKLDANENPFGAPPGLAEALAAAADYHTYPDPLQVRLRAALADHLGLPAARIVAGAGSDELIDLTFRVLVGPGAHLIDCPPTFGMYAFLAGVLGLPVVTLPRTAAFALDLEAIQRAITPETALVVLAAPNNPTGNGVTDAQLAALLGTGVTVVLDEAYAEFAGRSYVDWVRDHPRLIVLRTFSKWAGLAGLRVGYGVFPPLVAETLLKVKQPYNVNRAGEVAALAALRHRGALLRPVRAIVQERERLFEALRGTGWLEPFPSEANFLLCRVHGAPAAAVEAALAQRGVFVRYFDSDRLRDCLRISIPRPDQTPVLLERLRAAGASLGLR